MLLICWAQPDRGVNHNTQIEKRGKCMPRYRYQAVDQNGKNRKGQLQASGERELHGLLLEQGLYLIQAEGMKEKRGRYSLKPRELEEFSRELGTMIHSGIPMVKVLTILSQEEGIRPGAKRIYQAVLAQVCQGVSLAAAMEQQNAFPVMMISMLQAAEASGRLEQTALRLAEHYSREHRLAGKIRNAMIYPKILIVLLTGVTAFLIGAVLPQFEQLFQLMEELPLSTRILYGISYGVRDAWYLAVLGCGLLWVLWRRLQGLRPIRRFLDHRALTLPVLGPFRKTVYTARFARMLSSLYSAGIPVVPALQIGKRIIGNVYLEEQLEGMISRIKNGMSLSQALGQTDGFLKKLSFSVQVGEEAGSLDAMLLSVANALEYDAELAINRMVSYLEPAMICVMALMVGFVMVAIMTPIYGSYEALEQIGL